MLHLSKLEASCEQQNMVLGEDSGDSIPPKGEMEDCGKAVLHQSSPLSPHLPASLVQNHFPLVQDEWKKYT